MSATPRAWIALSGAVPQESELKEHGWSELGIRFTVARLVERILDEGGGIALGSHPTFVPLIEPLAAKHADEVGANAPDFVTMYVARRFFREARALDKYEEAHKPFARINWVGMFDPPNISEQEKSQLRQEALTELRKDLICPGQCQALVCVGGRPPRADPSRGTWERAGVEEESSIARDHKLPIYLVGAGGGYAEELYKTTYKSQASELRNGLNVEENETLATSSIDPETGEPYYDPWMAATLVLKGLRELKILS